MKTHTYSFLSYELKRFPLFTIEKNAYAVIAHAPNHVTCV